LGLDLDHQVHLQQEYQGEVPTDQVVQQVVVLETEEFQVVLQAFLEGLLTLRG